MILRIFVFIALLVLIAAFLWFAGTVIWLGLREFFKPKTEKKANKAKTP